MVHVSMAINFIVVKLHVHVHMYLKYSEPYLIQLCACEYREIVLSSSGCMKRQFMSLATVCISAY